MIGEKWSDLSLPSVSREEPEPQEEARALPPRRSAAELLHRRNQSTQTIESSFDEPDVIVEETLLHLCNRCGGDDSHPWAVQQPGWQHYWHGYRKEACEEAAMSALKFQNFDDVIKYPAFSALETMKRMYMLYTSAANKDFTCFDPSTNIWSITQGRNIVVNSMSFSNSFSRSLIF